jgi:hypothetical protein
VTSRSRRNTRPEVGYSNPAMVRRVVVFPDPLAPRMGKKLSSRDSQGGRLQRPNSTKLLAHAIQANVVRHAFRIDPGILVRVTSVGRIDHRQPGHCGRWARSASTWESFHVVGMSMDRFTKRSQSISVRLSVLVRTVYRWNPKNCANRRLT